MTWLSGWLELKINHIKMLWAERSVLWYAVHITLSSVHLNSDAHPHVATSPLSKSIKYASERGTDSEKLLYRGKAELVRAGTVPCLRGDGEKQKKRKENKKEQKIGSRFKQGNCCSKPQGCRDASCCSEDVFNSRLNQDSDSAAS